MTRPTVPSLLVEKLAAGELPPDKAEEVRARLAEAGELDRLTDLQRDNEQMLAHLTPTMVRRQVERRVEEARTVRRRRTTRWVGILAAAGLVGAFALPRLLPSPSDSPTQAIDEGNRIKGLQPELRAWLQTDDGPVILTDGATVHEGDLLQLSYVAAGRPHGAILSRDGRGVVTLHTATDTTTLTPSGEQLLPFSYQLDDAPDHETFFFVTSDRPLDVAHLVRQLERGADTLSRPDGSALTTYTLRLRKEAE